MKALTFVSMFLLAISGATAQSVPAQSSTVVAASQAASAAGTTDRICMRCRLGG